MTRLALVLPNHLLRKADKWKGDIVLQFDRSHCKHNVTGMGDSCCDWDVVQGLLAVNHHSKLTELLGT